MAKLVNFAYKNPLKLVFIVLKGIKLKIITYSVIIK